MSIFYLLFKWYENECYSNTINNEFNQKNEQCN